MKYTTLGRTGLRVSVAGLGCGGFSRLGLATGKTEADAATLVRQALEFGINLIDTAPSYDTEGVVGKALKSVPRQSVVLATKVVICRDSEWFTPDRVVESLDNSLRQLSTDYIDVLQLHGVHLAEYDYALNTIVPALMKEQAKGQFRHLGITEAPSDDAEHEMLQRAAQDDVWDVTMVAFHLMHQNARNAVFPQTMAKRVGTLLMFAVRNIFARSDRLRSTMRDLTVAGQVEKWLAEAADPLGFLIHEGGAKTITEAAYRFARHEPGVDVVLFGTGDTDHLRTNIASLLKPALPDSDRQKLSALFGHLTGIGLELPPHKIARKIEPIHTEH